VRTFLDCIPCFLRQALDAARLVTTDEGVHLRVLREVLAATSEMDLREPPPVMGQRIHRMIRNSVGQDDPYRQVKRRFNDLALSLYPELRERVEQAADPMATAALLAIAGNVIDFGVGGNLHEGEVLRTVKQALDTGLEGRVDELADAAEKAEDILYIADNAGEIVFDRLLIEQLPLTKLTLAVRGSPVINDACLEDAEAAGLTDMVEVIDNGSDAPGTILQSCSEGFRLRFARADMIIAKGQGNYETLSDADKDIFFLLKAKCPVIADHIGCQVGSLLMRRTARGFGSARRARDLAGP